AVLTGAFIVWNPQMRAQAAGTTAAVPRPATASPAGRSYTITETTGQLLTLLQSQLFTDSGRFYPCRGNPACSSWGENLALSAPVVQINGQRLTFAVHVAGSYAVAAGFAPSIAGDL